MQNQAEFTTVHRWFLLWWFGHKILPFFFRVTFSLLLEQQWRKHGCNRQRRFPLQRTFYITDGSRLKTNYLQIEPWVMDIYNNSSSMNLLRTFQPLIVASHRIKFHGMYCFPAADWEFQCDLMRARASRRQLSTRAGSHLAALITTACRRLDLYKSLVLMLKSCVPLWSVSTLLLWNESGFRRNK